MKSARRSVARIATSRWRCGSFLACRYPSNQQTCVPRDTVHRWPRAKNHAMRTAAIVLLLVTPCLAQNAQTNLKSKIEAIAADAHGRVGVACSLPGTQLDCDVNPDAKLPMQSVYKFPLAMAVLNQIEHGKLTLDTKVRFLRSDMISPGQY